MKNKTQAPAGKTIPQFSNYIITEDGKVYSIKRSIYLSPSMSYKNGYLQVILRDNEQKTHTIKIHTLVARAFIGERPAGMNVNHISGVKTDNNISNLEYVTQYQNMRHAVDNGMIKTGDSSRLATKCQDTLVDALLDVIVHKESKTAVGGKYGLSIQYINQVLWGKLRRSVWDDPKLEEFKTQYLN